MDKFPVRHQTKQWTSRQGLLKPVSFPGNTSNGNGHAQSSNHASNPDHPTVLGPPPGSSQSGRSGTRHTGSSGGTGHAFRKPLSLRAGNQSEADRLFKLKLVDQTAQRVLAEKLKGVAYDSGACRDMCPDVASTILDRVRQFSLDQYKMVCVVSLGSLAEKPGVQFGSRCLWNKETDNFISVKYSNGSVYAVALIFGLYFD